MVYSFDYDGVTYNTKSEEELEDFVMAWIKNNWEAFIEFGNNTFGYITKDNYETVLEAFFERNVTEK